MSAGKQRLSAEHRRELEGQSVIDTAIVAERGYETITADQSAYLSALPAYAANNTVTRRTPDILIAGHWALEIKLARPFGDNGKLAENWSVNLLHPYPGNVSAIGDCLKLESWAGPERRASIVIGYEHTPPQIELAPLFTSFETIARTVVGLNIGSRVHTTRRGLVHPIHQQVTVVAWEVTPRRFG